MLSFTSKTPGAFVVQMKPQLPGTGRLGQCTRNCATGSNERRRQNGKHELQAARSLNQNLRFKFKFN